MIGIMKQERKQEQSEKKQEKLSEREWKEINCGHVHTWIDLNDLKLVRESSGEKEGYPMLKKCWCCHGKRKTLQFL
jgi:hypothetical protein